MFDHYIARRRGKRVARFHQHQTGWYHFETDVLYFIAVANGWPTEGTQWNEYATSAQHELNCLAERDGVQPVYAEL